MYESVGENLAYATYEDDDGVDVIMQFIIDDGVTGRGHRANIFNTEWTHVGIACGCHG